MKTDFANWERTNLEAYAQESTKEIEALKEELKVALAAWRHLIKEKG